MTYPITIGSVLHENSPYTLRNQRLLPEGLRSLMGASSSRSPAPYLSPRARAQELTRAPSLRAALRRTLHPPEKEGAAKAGLPPAPLRIFVLGARAESSLPSHVLAQLSHLFPSIPLHLVFIGPEAYIPAPAPTRSTFSSSPSPSPSSSSAADDAASASSSVYGVPSHTRIEHDGRLTVTSLRCNYSDVHDVLGPFDPYQDVFFAFSPGFGFPDEADPTKTQLETNWSSTVKSLLETKCALFCTGFSPADIERDVVALDQAEGIAGEFDWLVTPGENVFGSEKWEVAEFDPRVAVKTNWGVWGIRCVLLSLCASSSSTSAAAESRSLVPASQRQAVRGPGRPAGGGGCVALQQALHRASHRFCISRERAREYEKVTAAIQGSTRGASERRARERREGVRAPVRGI